MSANDLVIDAALDYIIANCNAVRLCSSDPGLTYTSANNEDTGSPAGFRIGDIAPNLSKANGATDGRALVMGTQSGGSIVDDDAVGADQFWAFIDTVNSRVLITCPVTNDQVTTDGNSLAVTTPFEAYVIRDPT